MGSIAATMHAQAEGTPTSKLARTSLQLPRVLDRNLELYCAMNGGISKNAAVVKLIETQLKAEGYKTDKLPKLVYD